MIPVKVQCGCGQRYSFEVEPVNGRMPSTIACPVCAADGTAAADAIIEQKLSGAPPPPPPRPTGIPAMRLSTATTPPPTAAPAPVAPETPSPAASQISQLTQRIAQAADEDGEGAKWKWWYFILAGVCIGGFSIWSAYTQHRIKPLGELFFAAFCIAIGIWDFQAKRKQK